MTRFHEACFDILHGSKLGMILGFLTAIFSANPTNQPAVQPTDPTKKWFQGAPELCPSSARKWPSPGALKPLEKAVILLMEEEIW